MKNTSKKRPHNAFNLFCAENRSVVVERLSVSDQVPGLAQVQAELSSFWRSLKPEEKQKYEQKAAEAKLQFDQTVEDHPEITEGTYKEAFPSARISKLTHLAALRISNDALNLTNLAMVEFCKYLTETVCAQKTKGSVVTTQDVANGIRAGGLSFEFLRSCEKELFGEECKHNTDYFRSRNKPIGNMYESSEMVEASEKAKLKETCGKNKNIDLSSFFGQ